jgi:hypothetical protein
MPEPTGERVPEDSARIVVAAGTDRLAETEVVRRVTLQASGRPTMRT